MKRAIKKHQDKIKLYAGIPELLHDLKKSYRIGLIGGGRPSYHEAILKRHKCDIFDFRIGNRGTKKHKTIKKIMQKYNLKASQVSYIGDDTQDVISANKLAINSIAVTWGGSSKKILIAAKPSTIVESVKALRENLL
jgi:phosphoglycolate phosphatase